MLEEKINELWQLLENSKMTIALTGAGISTLSGIPDFRSDTGLWSRYDPDKIFSYDLYPEEPHHFWNFAFEFIYDFFGKSPNIVHRVLAQLEKHNQLQAIITQNIDMLHQQAGSKKVIEVHGSPSRHYCLQCLSEMPLEQVLQKVKNREIPRCSQCGGLIKPDITFFGEMLPQHAINEAIELSRQAEVMLLLGSSMVVYPANMLPQYFLQSGGDLVIVNRQSTQYDGMATLRFDDLELVFRELEKRFI